MTQKYKKLVVEVIFRGQINEHSNVRKLIFGIFWLLLLSFDNLLYLFCYLLFHRNWEKKYRKQVVLLQSQAQKN